MHLWSVGRYYLRLSDEEFWDLTPAQFQALIERYDEEQSCNNFRAGLAPHIIESALSKKPRQPLDYFKIAEEETEEEKSKSKYEETMAKVRAHNAMVEARKRIMNGGE